MKNLLTLVLAIIMFVALGCSFMGSTEKDENPTIETPNPTADSSPETTDSKTDSDDSKTDSDDSKNSSSSVANLTLDKFNRLEIGMDYDEVVKILGSEGEQSSETKTSRYTITSYKWAGEDYAAIYATFRDGKMTSKRQLRLSGETEMAADISKDKFDKVKIGMSYDEVVKIIGSEGNETSSTRIGKTELKSYKWSGEGNSAIYGTFRNGELSSKRQFGLK